MPKITNCLWFDRQAEEAARFYVSVFPNSKMGTVTRYPEGFPPDRKGEVLTVAFTLDGVEFVGLNGGPDFKFTEAVSFQIDVDNQAELDRYWNALLAGGGEESMCGWLKDRYGLSWQVVPRQMMRIWEEGGEAADRAAKAMMQMRKLDIARLEAAARGETVAA